MAGYGVFLAVGTFVLQWLDYQAAVRMRMGDDYLALVALLFLALGIFVGARALRAPAARPFDGNPKAIEALKISPRELTVLHELAAGKSNKQIAQSLQVSPNTVKTHVARLFEKLEAQRRTQAIHRARALGIVP
ncbi:MAG: response regulator transcription factor [Sphingomonas sp.]|nr:response regulator transcription factor [Sphingomonas sp.]